MKVFLDDIRPEPNGWVRTYTPQQTIDLLKTGKVTDLSLDHDLGIDCMSDEDGLEQTGYDVILWIEEEVICNGFVPPKITIHSDNPVGRQKMEAGIEQIKRLFTKVNGGI